MDPMIPNPTIVTAIQSRRTIKEFRSDPVPEETLWRILDAARWAPNHRLTEPWRIAMIGMQSRETLADALANLTESSQDPSVMAKAKEGARKKVMSSPVLLAVTCRLAGNRAQQVEDLAAVCAAVQNLQLAAWSEGIGTHWNTGKVTRLPETSALLELSERGEQLVGFLYLGYPAQVPEAPKRQPIQDFVRNLP
ncbi:MAG: nitroreductase [Verrucomicrobia bacterium]|nr:nitroreductase [Verrucomicrobiota bacterium]